MQTNRQIIKPVNYNIVKPPAPGAKITQEAWIYMEAHLANTPPTWAFYRYRLGIIGAVMTLEPQTQHNIRANCSLNEALLKTLTLALQDLQRRTNPSNDGRKWNAWRVRVLSTELAFLPELAAHYRCPDSAPYYTFSKLVPHPMSFFYKLGQVESWLLREEDAGIIRRGTDFVVSFQSDNDRN